MIYLAKQKRRVILFNDEDITPSTISISADESIFGDLVKILSACRMAESGLSLRFTVTSNEDDPNGRVKVSS